MADLNPLRLLTYLTANMVVSSDLLETAEDLDQKGLIDFEPEHLTAVLTEKGRSVLASFAHTIQSL